MRAGAGETESRTIPAGNAELTGDLTIPDDARGLVLFAHGSGSSRLSPRNRYVAGMLQEAGLGTLLFDLLTPDEEIVDERTAQLRFDIPLLALRLGSTTDWLATQTAYAQTRLGYFGASTGAAAALMAAATPDRDISAIVSRGGRPDLAADVLPRVRAPTLLIVGGLDYDVLDLNQQALAAMRCEKKLEVVTGATHLFEEPGTLERAAELARDWLVTHLR